jgi:NTP pyrophosphatase (non-canonical NTP hydrolase)
MAPDGLVHLQQRLRAFAAEREWEQYHTPKNLAMALAAEVGELLEHFQWLTPEESLSIAGDRDALNPVRDEIADVVIYLARLADILGIDILVEANKKVDRNADRFPPAM